MTVNTHGSGKIRDGKVGHTFFVCGRRQGSVLCPLEFEQLSLRKVRRLQGYGRKHFSGGKRQSETLIPSKHRWKNTVSGMTLIFAGRKLKEAVD